MAAGSSARSNCSPPRGTAKRRRSCRSANKRLPLPSGSAQNGQKRRVSMDQAASIADDKPTWCRIVDFPLVAMVISVALFLVTVAVAATISNHLLPRVPGFTAPMSFDIVCAVLLILLYKLVIRRLGEH